MAKKAEAPRQWSKEEQRFIRSVKRQKAIFESFSADERNLIAAALRLACEQYDRDGVQARQSGPEHHRVSVQFFTQRDSAREMMEWFEL